MGRIGEVCERLIHRDLGGREGRNDTVLFLVRTESDGGADDAELTRTPGGQDGRSFSVGHTWKEKREREKLRYGDEEKEEGREKKEEGEEEGEERGRDLEREREEKREKGY